MTTQEAAASLFPKKQRSALPTVSESGREGKQFNAYVTSQMRLLNAYDGRDQQDSLHASILTNRRGNELVSEDVSLNTERSEKTTILDRSSGMVHTSLSSWKFDDATLEKDGDRYEKEMNSKNGAYTEEVSRATTSTGGHNVDDFRAWQLQKKARGRKKVGLRNSTFIKRKAGQPLSSSNHNINTSWDTRSSIGPQQKELRSSQSSKESTRLTQGVDTSVAKPAGPTVTWQSLMAAGRCQLSELRIPGYDQFLMKTKEYELAKDTNREKVVFVYPVKSLRFN